MGESVSQLQELDRLWLPRGKKRGGPECMFAALVAGETVAPTGRARGGPERARPPANASVMFAPVLDPVNGYRPL